MTTKPGITLPHRDQLQLFNLPLYMEDNMDMFLRLQTFLKKNNDDLHYIIDKP